MLLEKVFCVFQCWMVVFADVVDAHTEHIKKIKERHAREPNPSEFRLKAHFHGSVQAPSPKPLDWENIQRNVFHTSFSRNGSKGYC